MATSLNAAVDYEAKAMKAHNLDTVLVEWRFSGSTESGPHEMGIKSGRLVRNAPALWAHKPLKEFSESHRGYLSQLERAIDKNVIGLRDRILGAASVSSKP